VNGEQHVELEELPPQPALSIRATIPAGDGQVSGGELPGGPAVTTWHFGPHDRLGEAYGRIERWRTEHSREPAGPGWEVYHWIDLASGEDASPADPSTWRVRLVQPIK
jgi:effector-binding domain-containing protein